MKKTVEIIVTIAVVYIGLSCMVYALNNPSKTNTQIFLNLWQIVTWQW